MMSKKLVDLEKYGFMIDKSTIKKEVYLRESVAKALIKARDYLGEEYNFKIYEGKRSITEQKKIIKTCEKEFRKESPDNWEKLLNKYTGGYSVLKQKKFAPDSHLGAGAVDLTIIKNKKELEMGKIVLENCSHLNYYEKKKRLTKKEKEIRDNRLLLKNVMKKAGFKPYLPEWWHWGFIK